MKLRATRLIAVSLVFALAAFSNTVSAKKNSPIIASSPELDVDLSLLSLEIGAESTIVIGSASSGGGAGKTTFKELTFTKHPDAATTQLFEYLTKGQHISDLVITQANVAWELGFVMVQDYSTSGNSGLGEVPTETWVLQFGLMKVITDYDEYCWDRVLNGACQ